MAVHEARRNSAGGSRVARQAGSRQIPKSAQLTFGDLLEFLDLGSRQILDVTTDPASVQRLPRSLGGRMAVRLFEQYVLVFSVTGMRPPPSPPWAYAR
ncbi:hypothetical protein BLN97_39065 [Bradyrhizobium elkanii]|nr:hypothetical protein BLN97_39065 [Bradyrhizobium elkanii]